LHHAAGSGSIAISSCYAASLLHVRFPRTAEKAVVAVAPRMQKRTYRNGLQQEVARIMHNCKLIAPAT
jgi:hypothetical protein